MKVFLMLAAVLLPFAAARTLVGGEKPINVDDNDAVVAFASSEINGFLMKENANAKPSAVIKVISATKQIVAGILYRLDIKMSGDPNNKICSIEVFTQPWISASYKAQNIHCNNEVGALLGGDGHDQKSHGQVMPGGIVPMNVGLTDDKVTFAASAVNDYLLEKDANAAPSTVLKVLSATKQTVSGILYRLELQMSGNQVCSIHLLLQAWVSHNYQLQKVHCEPEVQALLGGDGHDQQHHGRLTGGIEPMDVKVTDDKVTFAASAVNDYLLENGVSTTPSTVLKVLSASKQVVAGLMYRLKLQMSGNQICDIKILSQPWVQEGYQLSHVHCEPEVSAVHGDGTQKALRGGIEPIDVKVTDDKVTFAASAVNDYLLEKDATAAPSTVLKVLSASKQVVAGIMYRLKLQMSGNQICDIKVLSQPWVQKGYQLSNVHCEPEVSAVHGDGTQKVMPGGIEPMDVKVTDDKVTFAASAVNDYLLEKDATAAPSTVLKVLSATKQVVAGIMYRLKLQMSGNQICDIKILSQPWVQEGYQLSHVHCEPEVSAVHGDGTQKLLGGEEAATFDDEDVKHALAVVTERFNGMSNSLYRGIPSGGQVTKQIVQGIIYRFKGLEMRTSTCRNNEVSVGKTTVEECPINANDEPMSRINAKVYWNQGKFEIQSIDVLS